MIQDNEVADVLHWITGEGLFKGRNVQPELERINSTDLSN